MGLYSIGVGRYWFGWLVGWLIGLYSIGVGRYWLVGWLVDVSILYRCGKILVG